MLEPGICINHGCNNKQAYSHTKTNGNKRYRPVCERCHVIGYKKKPYPPGVTPYKTGKCKNQDSHLGFVCPLDYEKAPWAIGFTEIDHIDGNHLNNTVENTDELCPICHNRKGRENGDLKGYRY